MKTGKTILLVLFFQAIYFTNYGQEISLEEGSFKILNASKVVDLQFTYDSLHVGKYKHEADYVQKRVTEINKKTPGKGDEWAKQWTAQRKTGFEPAFIQAFKASSGKDTLSGAKYRLIFNTNYIEQGFSSAAIMVHKNPEIRGELTLVESADPTKVVAKAKITKAMGKAGPHFETGEHLDGAYNEAGEGLGSFILNN
jgi:hypothetical protein